MKPLNNISKVNKSDRLTLEHLMKAVKYVRDNAQKRPLLKD